jgi:hypothetical protein
MIKMINSDFRFLTDGEFLGNAVDGQGDVNSINLCPPPPNFICFENPPVITCPADTTVDCSSATDSELLGEATADRRTPDCPLNVEIFFEDDISVNGCESVITRTWTVVDEYDNVVSCDQLITVVDTTAPELEMPAVLEGDITYSDIGLEAATGFATATDNCIGIMKVTYEDLYVSDICPSSFVRLWTAVDECGNVATCEQLITTVEERVCVTAPNGLEAEVVGSNSIQFSWNPVPNSVAYRVFGRASGSSANISLGTVMVPSLQDSCLPQGSCKMDC